MKRVVISLERTPERLAAFRRNNPHLDCQVFAAVDGQQFTPQSFVADGYSDGSVHYTPGAMGCAASHIALWRHVAQTDLPLTVFEDDAIVHRAFDRHAEQLAAAVGGDWDIVLWGWNFDGILHARLLPGLGDCFAYFDQRALRANAAAYVQADRPTALYRLRKAFGTIGYSVSPSGARKFLDYVLPIRETRMTIPEWGKSLRNYGLDIMMCGAYERFNSFVSFPPLVVTHNDHKTSTVQAVPAP